jgi:hypothetical protein
MKLECYFHNCEEHDVNSTIDVSVMETLHGLHFKIYPGCSRKLRDQIKGKLIDFGWSDEIEIEASTRISITSVNGDYGLCLQTGNMSRFYADLLKLEYLYKNGKICGAFYILPSKSAADILGSNVAHFNRLTQELNVFKDVITIPIKVIGIR